MAFPKLPNILNKQSDDNEEFEVKTLVEEAMTPREKSAYDYFHKAEDESTQKKGCLHKGSDEDIISDDEYDRLVMERLNEFGSKAKALAKIGMDIDQVNEIEPIRFFGFEKYRNRLNNTFSSKVCDDGRWRSSVCSVTWLFFSNDQLCMYGGRFDMFSSDKREITDEYFYKDITNFTTITETDQKIVLKSNKGCLKTNVDTERKLTDYDTFALIVPGDRFSCSVSGVPNAASVIDGVKQKLREKKLF